MGILSGMFGVGGKRSSLHSPLNSLVPSGITEVPDTHDMLQETYVPNMCIRVNVKGTSRFRICDMDPQDEAEATWGTVTGTFQQCFFIKSNCNGRPAMSDRVVSITVDTINDSN